MKKHEYLEYRDEPLESILDYKGLRKSIKDFKEDKALEVLWNFVDEDNRFLPISPNEKGEAIDLGIHNIGIFSTAVCLETIAAYRRNVIECRKKIRGVDWVWTKLMIEELEIKIEELKILIEYYQQQSVGGK